MGQILDYRGEVTAASARGSKPMLGRIAAGFFLLFLLMYVIVCCVSVETEVVGDAISAGLIGTSGSAIVISLIAVVRKPSRTILAIVVLATCVLSWGLVLVGNLLYFW
jgi:hypothetical protein